MVLIILLITVSQSLFANALTVCAAIKELHRANSSILVTVYNAHGTDTCHAQVSVGHQKIVVKAIGSSSDISFYTIGQFGSPNALGLKVHSFIQSHIDKWIK